MAIKKIFKSRSKNVCYTFACRLKKVQFMHGVYFTDEADEIAELEKEIKLGHPMFYIDPADFEIDTEAEAKALQKLKDDTIAEYIASQELLEAGDKDMGTTTPQPLNPATTEKLKNLVAGSTSGAVVITP